MAGPIECLLSNDVYSTTASTSLFPQASKLSVRPEVESLGQSRWRFLPIAAHARRLFRSSIISGLEPDRRRWSPRSVNQPLFCASLALARHWRHRSCGRRRNVRTLTASARSHSQGFAQSTRAVLGAILDRFLHILRPSNPRGAPIKVYLSGDLALPDYANQPCHRSVRKRKEKDVRKKIDLLARDQSCVGAARAHSGIAMTQQTTRIPCCVTSSCSSNS